MESQVAKQHSTLNADRGSIRILRVSYHKGESSGTSDENSMSTEMIGIVKINIMDTCK